VSQNNLGKLGEDCAVTRLTSLGYSLVERNFHNYYGELDLIMRKNGELIFVEVKTVSSGAGYEPVEQMTRRKLIHIRNTINGYLSFKNISEKQVYRLDFVGIIVDDSDIVIKFDHRQSID